MTTSPPPSVSAGTTALLDEKAANIGWFFINKYYDFHNQGIENIFKIYQKSASISHSGFPGLTGAAGTEKIHKAKGIDAIKLRYENDESAVVKNNNRIVITDAAFEVSLDKNILIVVFGEWSKGNSPYYQFTQTFLLTPGANNNTFDVANDVLRFTNYDQISQKSEKATEAQKAPQTEKSDKAAKAEPAKEPVKAEPVKSEPVKTEPVELAKSEVVSEPVQAESSKPEIVKPVEVKSEDKVDGESKKNAAPQVVESKQETPDLVADSDESKAEVSAPTTPVEAKQTHDNSKAVADATEELKPETETESTATPSPSKPAAPLSWAALASQAAASKPNKPTVVSPATVTKSTAPVKKTVPTAPNGKFRKEEWFPIYIRGVRPVDEKNLKDHLSKTFGELKFFRTNLNIALVDFVTQEAQMKALEAKEIDIDGVTISLEPRESKTANNFHNNPKKTKDNQKDLKRNRPEKKVTNGKKPVTKKD